MRSVSRLALLPVLVALGAPVEAQTPNDDWQVTRPRHPPRVVARYRAMLERNPEDRDALRRVLAAHTLATLVRDYRARVAKQPDDANLHHLLGLLERRAGHPDEAIAEYEAAARLAADRPAVHVALGELYRQRGRGGEARAAWERVLVLVKGPARKGALRALADLALADQDVARARTLFHELFALEPKNLALRAEWAEALVRSDQLTEALAELKDLERRQGGNVARRIEIMKRRGEVHEKLGADDAAAALYREAFGLAPRGHWLRRDVFDRMVAMARKRDTLRALLADSERTFKDRGFFEWDALARLYEEVGEPQRALEAYRQASQKDRTAVETRERLIRLLDRLGESAQALAEYERLIVLAPGEARYQLELAERRFRRGDRAKALALLKRCTARFAGDASVHAALADLYARWGEPDLALRESEILVRAEPHDQGHVVNLGDQYFQRGKKQRAIEVWKRLLTLGKREQGMARLAEVYADHDLLLEAIDLYQKALKLAPTDPLLHRGLARIYERQRRGDPAVNAWGQVLKHARGGAARGLKREARGRIVSLLAKSHRLVRRVEEYRLRLMRNPADLESAYFLVAAYLALGRPDEAGRILDHILQRDPADGDALAARARVHRSRRRFAQAISDLERLAALQPARARDCLEQMAALAHLMGRDAAALDYARRALALAPADASAHAHLAGLFEKRDDAARAIAEYRKAIELAPHGFGPYFAAARLLARTGAPAAAVRLYREVLRRANDEDVLAKAGRRAMDLEEYLGSLGELERELWPLAFAQGRKPVYRKLLVELFDRYAPPLVARAGRGELAAQAELRRLGEHGLAPLLEALGDDGSSQQRLALLLLGHFANRSAAPALMRLTRAPTRPPPPPSPPVPAARARLRRVGRPLFRATGRPAQVELRVLALYAAGRLGEPKVEGEILRLADEHDVTLRAAATWSLASYADPPAQAALLHALSDRRYEVLALACLALGYQRTPQAALPMAAVMADRMRPDLARAACAQGLGLLGAREAVPALIRALDDTPPLVRARAATALGRIGDARAVVPLLRAYLVAPAPVRRNALWALHRLRPPAATSRPGAAAARPPPEMPLDPSAKPDLPTLLARLDPAAAAPGAAWAVVAAREQLPALLREALTRRDVTVRVLADLDTGDLALGLGALLGDHATLERAARRQLEATLANAAHMARVPVRARLGDRDPRVRRAAMRVGARLGLDEAVAVVVQELGADDAGARDEAVAVARRMVAGRCGLAPTLVTGAIGLLASPRWPRRVAAARALGHVAAVCDVRPARAALLRAARDPNGFVREAAIVALASAAARHAAASPEALAAFGAGVDDEAEAVRATTALALGRVLARSPDPRIVGLLRRLAASDQPAHVRDAAHAALNRAGAAP